MNFKENDIEKNPKKIELVSDKKKINYNNNYKMIKTQNFNVIIYLFVIVFIMAISFYQLYDVINVSIVLSMSVDETQR